MGRRLVYLQSKLFSVSFTGPTPPRMHAQCVCGTKSTMKVCCSCAARVLALRRHSVASVRSRGLPRSIVNKKKKGPAHVRPADLFLFPSPARYVRSQHIYHRITFCYARHIFSSFSLKIFLKNSAPLLLFS